MGVSWVTRSLGEYFECLQKHEEMEAQPSVLADAKVVADLDGVLDANDNGRHPRPRSHGEQTAYTQSITVTILAQGVWTVHGFRSFFFHSDTPSANSSPLKCESSGILEVCICE